MELILLVYIAAIIVFSVATGSLLFRRGLGALFLMPGFLSASFILLIHLVMPALQLSSVFYRYQSDYDVLPHMQALGMTIAGSMAFIIGLQIVYRPKFSRWELGKLSRKGSRNYLAISLAVFGVAFYFSFENIRLILTIGVDAYLSDRISLGVGRGAAVLLSHWTYVSCLLFFIGIYVTERRTLPGQCFRVLFLPVLAYTVGYYSLNSNRNSIFILVLNLIGFWFLFHPTLSKTRDLKRLSSLMKPVALIGLAAVLLFFVGKFRRAESSGYSVTHSLNGAFGNHENVLWLLSHPFEPQVGKTFLAAFANVVPRSVWPDKPFGAGPVLKNFITPGSYVRGGTKNSSLTTGLFTELLMNFGGWFFVPCCFVAGTIVSALLTLMSRFNQFIFANLFTSIAFSTQLFYQEFLGFLMRYGASLIPFLIVALIVKVPLYYHNENAVGREA